MTNTKVNERKPNGYMSFDQVDTYYNDYNVRGNDPTCKHLTYRVEIQNDSKPSINHYCETCGYRRLFLKYAKHMRKK
jgi:hypothetical protein